MTRHRWTYINGVAYEHGVDIFPEESTTGKAPTILADIPDFRSTIDGTIVRGRAGMRDHCARHNVVPLQDVKGLPPRTTAPAPLSAAYREGTKRTIAEIINSRY